MLNFKKISFEDREKIGEYVKLTDTVGSDYCCGSWFSWYDFEKMTWAYDGTAAYISADIYGDPVFISPLCREENYADAVKVLHDYCMEIGREFKIVFATENQVKHIKNFKLSCDRANSEYIYNPADLIGLEGKKYHGKRNHCHKFTSSYDFVFRSYDDDDYDGVVRLMDLWGENREKVSFEEEKRALLMMLKTCSRLSRLVDVIEIDGKIAAVSVGEITPANVGVVLFEKGDVAYEGIYAALNQMFAEKHFKNVRYINRQEDMGIEGLRKSKMSYNPAFLLDKYTVTEPDDVQLSALYRESFDDSDEYADYFLNVMSKNAEKVTVENNGTVASALYLFDKTLTVAGRDIPCAFVTAVATRRGYRNKGYMTKLLDKALLRINERGIPLALLCPFKPDFYSKFGFCTIDFLKKQKVRYNPCGYTVKAESRAEVVKSAYDEFAKDMCYKMNRSAECFAERLAELAADGGETYVIYKNALPCGYFLYRDGEIEEGAYTSEMLACAEVLDGKEASLFCSEGEGSSQARIVNAQKLCEYADFKPDCSTFVVDDVIENNEGTYRFDGEKIVVDADGKADRTIKIDELTEMFFKFSEKYGRKGFIVDRY